jgi:2-aminoadipate transaminase
MQVQLSSYGHMSTRPAPVSQLMAGFAHDFRDGIDINLGVGYVNEKTIPIAELRRAMDGVIADPARYRQAFNYGSPAGSANLVGSLRRFLAVNRTGGLDDAALRRLGLAIGACGATSILDAIAQVLPLGIVVTSDPMYYIYTEALERRGFTVLAVPEDAEGIDTVALERKLQALSASDARRISFFYVVTVNNPSCTVLSNRRRRELLRMATAMSREQGRLIPVFYDLAYELLLHDPAAEPFRSVLGGCEDELGLAYEIGTLSKVLAPALRIGYVLGPGGPLLNALVQNTADTGFSAPLFVQEMCSYLLDAGLGDQLRAVNAGYRQKALAVRRAIDRELGPYVEEVRGGSAGFYFYVTMREGIETHPASPFFRYLTKPGPQPRVFYIPGEYCVHPRGDIAAQGQRQMRLSYGYEDIPAMERALEIMRQAASHVVLEAAPPAASMLR